MSLQQLAIQHVRNISQAELEPVAGLNLVFGHNAAGKTSILEAIHILATARSFRTLHMEHIIQHDSTALLVSGLQKSLHGSDRIGVQRSRHDIRLRLNGEDIHKTSQIAQLLPLQIINPESHRVLEQGPKIRRKMLDWGVFHVEQQFADVWRTYNRVLKQRNSALRQGRKQVALSLDPQLIEISKSIDQKRQHYINRLQEYIKPFCEELIEQTPETDYFRGWSRDKSLEDLLATSIQADLERGYTHYGPHRAELRFKFAGKLAQSVLSRGQQKMLVSSLIMAQVSLFQEDSGRYCTLLVDDLPAE
ncbi:MAG: DNA replication/repair protein RecF, partial [Gammaproteobacteria bacterium]